MIPLPAASTAPNAHPSLVRVARHRLEASHLWSIGYLLAHNDRLLLMHHLSHDIRLDGYEVVRRSDVTAVETEFPQRQMLERALALKKREPFAPSGIALTDIPGTLASIQMHFPLVVIHRERVVPGECEIGTIKLAGRGTYALRWLSPNATWESDSRRFRFDDITRIGFGAEYETTLALVAGVTA